MGLKKSSGNDPTTMKYTGAAATTTTTTTYNDIHHDNKQRHSNYHESTTTTTTLAANTTTVLGGSAAAAAAAKSSNIKGIERGSGINNHHQYQHQKTNHHNGLNNNMNKELDNNKHQQLSIDKKLKKNNNNREQSHRRRSSGGGGETVVAGTNKVLSPSTTSKLKEGGNMNKNKNIDNINTKITTTQQYDSENNDTYVYRGRRCKIIRGKYGRPDTIGMIRTPQKPKNFKEYLGYTDSGVLCAAQTLINVIQACTSWKVGDRPDFQTLVEVFQILQNSNAVHMEENIGQFFGV